MILVSKNVKCDYIKTFSIDHKDEYISNELIVRNK